MHASIPVDRKLGDRLAALLPTREQTLFLRACLHHGPDMRDAWSRWERDASRDGTSPPVASLGSVAPFLPLLFWNGKRNGVSVDPEIESVLRSACMTEDVRKVTYRRVCRSAFETLSAAAIPFIALKGAALMDTVYPTPLLRRSGDIDVLLHREDLARATESLARTGWSQEPRPPLPNPKHVPPLVHESGVSIELHERLLIPYYTLPYDRLWARSRRATVAGVEALVLSDVDQLIHVCVHALCSEGWPILRWVPDAWFVLDRQPGLDWDLLLATAQQARVSVPLSVTLSYLAEEIGAPIPAPVLDTLRAEAARTGYLGRCAARLGTRPWTVTADDIWFGPGTRTQRLVSLWQRALPHPAEFALRYNLRPMALASSYVVRLARFARQASRTTW